MLTFLASFRIAGARVRNGDVGKSYSRAVVRVSMKFCHVVDFQHGLHIAFYFLVVIKDNFSCIIPKSDVRRISMTYSLVQHIHLLNQKCKGSVRVMSKAWGRSQARI